MPICHFEYTNNLPIEKKVTNFLPILHQKLVDITKTDLYTCRSTVACHDHYLIGDGASENAFIHLSVRILPGRTQAIKDQLGAELLSLINELFQQEIAANSTQIRVYITEVEYDYYYGL